MTYNIGSLPPGAAAALKETKLSRPFTPLLKYDGTIVTYSGDATPHKVPTDGRARRWSDFLVDLEWELYQIGMNLVPALAVNGDVMLLGIDDPNRADAIVARHVDALGCQWNISFMSYLSLDAAYCLEAITASMGDLPYIPVIYWDGRIFAHSVFSRPDQQERDQAELAVYRSWIRYSPLVQVTPRAKLFLRKLIVALEDSWQSAAPALDLYGNVILVADGDDVPDVAVVSKIVDKHIKLLKGHK
jgi:hypothetical protein